MRLVTFEVATVAGRIQRLGALLPASAESDDGERILDLNAAYAWWLDAHRQTSVPRRLANAVIPPTMRGFIEGGAYSLKEANVLLESVARDWNLQEASRYKGLSGENLIFHRSNVRLLAPLPDPGSLRDFMAFEAHIKRGYEIRGGTLPEQWYKYPVYYKGNPRTMIGPDEPVVWPRYTQKLDYELELACIIGRAGKNISEDDAMAHVFGYAILNDFSARDIQLDEMKVRLGPAKGKDFATGLGPWIITSDELPDPSDLTMTARVNGEQWSEGHSGTMHWHWSQMIAHASNEETLYPGDILGSGTVGGGCGYEQDRWLKPGDVVELEISHMGKLRNPIVTHEQITRSIAEPSIKGAPHVPAS